MSQYPRTILFLCTGNSCRSQMAEGFARAMAGTDTRVFSAGTRPKQVHPLAIEAMSEVGIDIRGQRSKGLDSVPLDQIDTLVTLCGSARETCPVPPGAAWTEHWPLDDPASATGSPEEVRAVFRQVRDEIRRRVGDLVSGARARRA